jgi:hypothetical protein
MSESGLVSRVSPVQTALRNCTRDEGRSFEVGNQVLISSHRKLLLSKATVVIRVASKACSSDRRLYPITLLNEDCVLRRNKFRCPTSALGHFRQIDPLPTLSACPPRSDRVRTFAPQRFDAMCQKETFRPQPTHDAKDLIGAYSITLSARNSSEGEIVSPIAFAARKLTTSSNLVGCSMGKSAGRAPRKILSTRTATRL